MPLFHCATCGAQFTPSDTPPERCPICDDARQYVPPSGQAWRTLDELRTAHRNEIRREGAYDGVGMDPPFAIGERALLVPAGDQFVMWDCLPLVDDGTADEIERRGGLAAIAISHPHYYTGMVDWAHRFDCPVLLHAGDREWIMRRDQSIRLWETETHRLGDGVTLIRCGGHFSGATVLHWDAGAGGKGALFTGDTIQVVLDRAHVSFMRSYPNLIPLSATDVRRIVGAVQPFAFDRIYGAFPGRTIMQEAKAALARSASRYVTALGG